MDHDSRRDSLIVTIQTEVGAPCDEEGGIPARMCDPLANLGCVGGICEYLGDGSDGSGCIPNDWGDTTCQPGLYCDYAWNDPTVPAVCRPLRSVGEPCSGSGVCEVACDYATGTCTDRYCAL